MCKHVDLSGSKCTYKEKQEWCGHHNPEKKKKKEKKISSDEVIRELCEKIQSLELALQELRAQVNNKLGVVELKIVDTQLSVKKLHKEMLPHSPPSRMPSLNNSQESYDALKSFTLAKAVNFDNSIDVKSISSSRSSLSLSTRPLLTN